MRRFLTTLALALAAVSTGPPARAAVRIYSYDSANKLTEQMTEQGLTFIFQKNLMSTRVMKIVETNNVGEAEVRPAGQNELGPGGLGALIGGAHERDLYEIVPKGDGRALIGALCPGADRGWLAIGPLRPDAPLRMHALGRDATTGKTRLCLTLDYSFHGEWALGPPELPQPDRSDRFNDAPENRRY